MPSNATTLPKRSLIGLNAANFFQAEMVGVILPILNAWLKQANWRYDAIGFATAATTTKAPPPPPPASSIRRRQARAKPTRSTSSRFNEA